MTDLETLRGRLIVSCQAPDGSPLRDPGIIAAIAEAATIAGAAAVRINSVEHVAAVRARVRVPIIGLEKRIIAGQQWITPSVDDAKALADAGADIVALDATQRARPGTPEADVLVPSVRALGIPVMADIDDLDSGLRAGALGAELVGTTLSGYTTVPQNRGGDPDIDLVRALAKSPTPVIAEGRMKTPDDVAAAFAGGAFAVVVGTSITEPMALTRRFLAAVPTLTKGATA
jgi:N-acylglucosamine-6-phosphate 2-epimerase